MSTRIWRRDHLDWRQVEAAMTRVAAAVIGPAVLFCVLTLMVQRYDAPLVLGGIVLVATAVAMFVQPQIATVLTVFLLYINFPAILTKLHGVPGVVAGAFILLLGVPVLDYIIVRRRSFKTDQAFGLMLVFLAVNLVSSLGAKDRGIAMEHMLEFVLEGLLLYWLVINVIRSRETLKRVIWTLLLAGAMLSSLAAYQSITGNYGQEFHGLAYRRYDRATELERMETGDERRNKWDRAQGPVNDPNRFAQMLIVLVPLSVFLTRTGRSPRQRWAAGGLGVMLLAGILLTMSRGAFLTLTLITAGMIVIRWIKLRHALICVALLMPAVVVYAPYYLERIGGLAASTSFLGADDASKMQVGDGAVRDRVTVMLAALYVFLDHPVIGVGPGQFSPFYVREYSKNADIKFREITTPRRAHSLYLEKAAELGLVGLASFMAIVLSLLYRLWLQRQRWLPTDSEPADLATAFCFSLLAYLSTGVFLHLSFTRYYWFLLALAGAGLHVLTSWNRTADHNAVRAYAGAYTGTPRV